MSTAIVWFRRDLRLQDNPALYHAAIQGHTIIPIYIYAPEEEAPWFPGEASRWWLYHSLHRLNQVLQAKQAPLLFFKGDSLEILQKLVKKTQATAVYWNRLYEPTLFARDQKIQVALQVNGITVQHFKSALLHEPWDIKNQMGKPYQIFTPFWKACQRLSWSELPLLEPVTAFKYSRKKIHSLPLKALNLLPTFNRTKGLMETWQPGENNALQRLQAWCTGKLGDYADLRDLRDLPGSDGVSHLSPHLHFGEISPRQVFSAIEYALHHLHCRVRGAESYERQLYWREFAYYLLYHYPETLTQPLRPEFKHFPWRNDYDDLLNAWQQGQTGYPLIDAGMRQLQATGWIHNRVRMVAASFLTKNCGVPWQEGARWFWETAVDADLANNIAGWQWVTGCGADAVPYYRIFNPLLQSIKFDPQGQYISRWIPELAHLPVQYKHRPWMAKPKPNYPDPIIDYERSRQEALGAYDSLKQQWQSQ